jgi:hypothetical protein
MVDVLPPEFFYMPEFFDMNLLMPLWAWILLGMIFVGFVAAVAMLYIVLIMKPVAGFGKVGESSLAKGSPTQVFSIWKNRSFVIESLWYYGNILAYGDPIKKMQMWFHNSEKATGLSAGKPVMITRDGYDGTVDFIAEMAVCEIPKIFNRDYGFEQRQKREFDPQSNKWVLSVDADGNAIMETVERKDDNGKPISISSFADIRRLMPTLVKLYPLIPIPIYQLYDLAIIYQFTPQGQDSLEFGGITMDDAKEWLISEDKPPKSWFEKNALLLMCVLMGIMGVAFVYMAFPITSTTAAASMATTSAPISIPGV